jgi:flagellar motor switch protein FliN
MTEHELLQALVEELGAAAAAMFGGTPVIEPGEEGLSALWAVENTITGDFTGTVTVALANEDAAKMAAVLLGFDEAPPDEVVTDAVKEIAQQVASATTVRLGPAITVEASPTVKSIPVAPGGSDWSTLVLGDLQIHLAVWSDLAKSTRPVAQPTPEPVVASAPRSVVVAPVQAPSNLDLILDIELPLWVRFGETAMTLQALTKLGPGTTLDLERSPDDPVDVMVNNTVIARGEVVVVSGNYGVRVIEVVSAHDRLRSMAG